MSCKNSQQLLSKLLDQHGQSGQRSKDNFKAIQNPAEKKKIQMRQDYIDDAQALCRIIPFPNLTHMLFPFHYEMVKQ